MKLDIKTIGIEMTPSFRSYAEEKLLSLSKFVKRFEDSGEAEIWLEVGRSTRHHKHGEVFSAAADLRLPKKILRAEAEAADARAAVDAAKGKLHLEILKYKTRFAEPKRKKPVL